MAAAIRGPMSKQSVWASANAMKRYLEAFRIAGLK